MTQSNLEPIIYFGQFGEYTITETDRQGVIVYRAGLAIAALCFAVGTALTLWNGSDPTIQAALTPLYFVFCTALGVSLLTIHIYMVQLHRLLQLFWLVGTVAAVAVALQHADPLALTVFQNPQTLWGMGFTFVALTGIYFKEAFCFNRLETKLLTPIVPLLLLGHLFGILPVYGERALLALWAVLFLVFAGRKVVQEIPPDIGDKSVFEYLKKGNG
ncbi:MAG TPA: DUF2301 domain-containing membrane protein [Oscillatoriales cyanobacterium M59_W2019_021]|nr:DUF2301 domain-containing membrane protein [Oscillatoriales cyanobacterium M4454_W2019_049]HIK52095.1 DUF2301 domain-containing membrane protein [Oscillatoriales cyanobacterium M59_W2019_021]